MINKDGQNSLGVVLQKDKEGQSYKRRVIEVTREVLYRLRMPEGSSMGIEWNLDSIETTN